MVLTDWTLTSEVVSPPSLDAEIKYAGNSSLKFPTALSLDYYSRATHNTFSETDMEVICWVRRGNAAAYPRISHVSYGVLVLTPTAINTWNRFRVSFWYDSTADVKWGRIERYDSDVWTQIGSDTNFGAGSPAAGAMYLEGNGTAISSIWFDELEVYA